jgi:HAD superfamily hydrolase (TIGR01662 family)
MANLHQLGGEPVAINSIRAVFFDFDGTLVFQLPDSWDVIRAFCAEIGQPLGAEAERRGRRARHEYFADPRLVERYASLSSDGFWWDFNRYLLQVAGVTGDLDCLAEELAARFGDAETVYHCPEACGHTLAELHARGYRLGLITNRNNVERFYELLEQTALQPHFDLIIAAGEVGVRKPEPGIFDAALQRIGVTPAESLYVGDNYWADVLGARRAGVTPALLDPYRLFPEADCLILEQIEDLLAWLS